MLLTIKFLFVISNVTRGLKMSKTKQDPPLSNKDKLMAIVVRVILHFIIKLMCGGGSTCTEEHLLLVHFATI